MAKLTNAEKIAYYREQIAKLEAVEASAGIRNNIEKGDNVTFNWGRGEKRRVLTGAVVGIKDDTNGRWVAILSGEGFDANTYKVRVADITANPDADARNGEVAVEEVSADLDPNDPLAAE